MNNLIKICMFSGCELPFSALQLWYPSETIYSLPQGTPVWVRGKQNMWSVYRTCQTTTPPATSVREKKCSLQTSLLEICFQVLAHLHIFTTVSQRSFFPLHHDYDTGNDLQSGLITGNERLRRYASCKNQVVKIINKIGLPRKQE